MPKNVTQYSVLIASPSDVMNERYVIQQVIQDWNASAGQTSGVSLSPIMWETHATPEMGDRPQAIINRQLVGDCDILVGVFWTRIGSPTGVAVSGTAEEINLFVEAQKPALVYFSSVPISPSEIDIEQYQKLLEFKKLARTKGLLGEFSTLEELGVKLHAALTRTVDRLNMTSNVSHVEVKAKDRSSAVEAVNIMKGVGVQADFGMKLVNAGLMTRNELIASLDTYVDLYFYDPRIHGLDPTRVDLEATTAPINTITGEIG
jgi:hypothetical protein